ncbi:MAG: acetyl-CoA synthetase [Actinomycetota bacterium]|nr:acetyl-CoA synthetase [Actinomycetota bacterium]
MTDSPHDAFRRARDLLLELRTDYEAAYREFRWPELGRFNWALDWFDAVAAGNDRPALRVIEEDGREARLSFAELAARSNRVANWLRDLGVRRFDRVIVMLGNQVELWETILAAIKLGAVLVPATPLLAPADLRDRVDRGAARHVVVRSEDCGKFAEVPGDYTRIAVGAPAAGWEPYDDAAGGAAVFSPSGETAASDPLLLYFTSGTTARPKLVEHTHASYPVGHLSTMYWLGLQPGDVHMNVASPGWAKHAWSSLFAPWNAEATILVYNFGRFRAPGVLDAVVDGGATTLCAAPTVWRMLIQEDLGAWRVGLREAASAGEPLNPEVIERVEQAWGIVVRDGYGQTETTAQVGNPPGQPVRPGSMGRPLPGYRVELLDPSTGEPGDEGEIALSLSPRPLGLMTGYKDQESRPAAEDRWYRTGDVGVRDASGFITYVGRSDDVFKAADYRISPFELESALIQHEAVAEAAVVPSPDPIRLAVPKAYVSLAPGHLPDAATALSILRHCRDHLAPYKRIRRLEFAELPKTISGKIRRVELRAREAELRPAQDAGRRVTGEFTEEDFPELKA